MAASSAPAMGSLESISQKVAAKRAAERAANLQVELEQLAAQNASEAHSEALLELLSMLQSQVLGERMAAVEVLSEVVSTAFGDDGARIGRICRESGAIDDLCDLLNHGPSRGARGRRSHVEGARNVTSSSS